MENLWPSLWILILFDFHLWSRIPPTFNWFFIQIYESPIL
jgi:hypothetical protein